MTSEETAAAYIQAIEAVVGDMMKTMPLRQFAPLVLALQREVARCARDSGTQAVAAEATMRFGDLALRATEAMLQQTEDNLLDPQRPS